uniref:Lipid-binding serum glycoprotein C-terminal domain-containing protein n=1 Tax=Junco hyemalis TaxID=40217 RepID=A0A8C5NRG6_JUNHY
MLLWVPSPSSSFSLHPTGACVAMLRTLSVLLSLLVPAHSTRSPDCGGILTPSGLRYRKWTWASHLPRECWGCQAGTSPSSWLKAPAGARAAWGECGQSTPQLQPSPLLPSSSTKEMRLSILADLHVDMNPEGNLEVVTSDCKPTLEEVQSTEETDRSICLEVSKLLLFPNERLMSLAAPFPITPNCQVQYLPLAAPMYSEQGIIISLQTTFQVAGAAIPLPVSPVPFSMPEPARSSPSHLILAFSEHFYTSLFSALEESGALNVSLLSSLTTATLAERITQMGSLFQEDLPVVLQAVTRSSPHVVLEEDKAIVQLFLTAQIGAGSSPFQSFLSVNVDVTARLQITPGDTSHSQQGKESQSGLGRAALLEELFLPTLREEVPAQINKVLRQGVFLPHIASFTYTDVNITIHKVTNKTFQLLPAVLDLKEAWEQC